jgi:UDP-glucose 4-epimerase
MTWIVTGGAGYIGSHVARCLSDSGRQVVVLDDLSSGHPEFVGPGVPLVRGSVTEPEAVDAAVAAAGTPVVGVVHLAGFKYAGVSVQRPLHTYRQNVTGIQVLLERMLQHGIGSMVFSSSAAVYGTPDVDLVTEQTGTAPESPYGESKLIGEWLLRDVAASAPLRHTSLRYFNVVGSGHDDLYDSSPHNLFPLVLKALTDGGSPVVRGTDYPTPDGSCVRDYVHVQDVALAHVAAAEALEGGRPLQRVYNLGSGDGLSVLQVMAAVARVTGIDFEPESRDRRPGDPARIVASGALAAGDLDWRMRHDVDQMVASAWQAWKRAAEIGVADEVPAGHG